MLLNRGRSWTGEFDKEHRMTPMKRKWPTKRTLPNPIPDTSDDRPLGRDDRIKLDMDLEDALRSMLRKPPSHDDPE